MIVLIFSFVSFSITKSFLKLFLSRNGRGYLGGFYYFLSGLSIM